MKKQKLITKASGEKVPFSFEQLIHSLKRSGANEETVNNVIKQIESNLYDGITTQEIFRLAFAHLRKHSKHSASRYKLKQSIMEFGPTGFPFEVFVGELLKEQGFNTTAGSIFKGYCVNHEVDVIAEKEDKLFMVECKFHNYTGIKCDVKIPLYIQSRFKDIERMWKEHPQNSVKFHQGWVVTNTHFSDDAIQYGVCAGLNLLGWDYPKNEGIKDLIDSLNLYPVTCLTSLTKIEKQQLIEKNILLCRDLLQNKKVLNTIGISLNRINGILTDCETIFNKKR